MQQPFGNVPKPTNIELQSTDANPAWVNVPGGRDIVGTCIHRMDGNLTGTDAEFKKSTAKGLTDFGVGGELDSDALNGKIYQWNDPNGNRSPIANGDDGGLVLSARGVAFVNAYTGAGDVNARLVSIETSGCSGVTTDGYYCGPENEVTDAQVESIAQLVAYIHDQAEIPAETFPNHPVSGVDTVLLHSDFSDKGCPWPKLTAKRDLIVARAKEIMSAAQQGKTPPPPTGSNPGDGTPGTPSDGQPGIFQANDKIKANAGGQLNLRAQPSTSAPVVTQMANGTEMCVTGAGKAAEGYTWYPVTTVIGNQSGHVAGDLCSRVTKNGCGTGTPASPYSSGDRIKTTANTKLVSSPGNASTSAPVTEMKVTDPIRGPQRGSSETAIAFARDAGSLRINDVIAYVNEIYRLAPTLEFDPAILIAQSALETNYWGPGWWNDRLNPAGLGITGTASQDQASQTFPTGTASARAQLAHMHAYVYGTSRALPSDLVGADNRYNTVLSSGNAGSVVTIDNLTGKWATDVIYGSKIVIRGNEIFGQVIQAAAAPPPAGTKIADLGQGTELCVTGAPTSADGYDWFPVERYDLKGFVSGQFTDIVEKGGCSAPTPTPSARFKAADQVRVSDGPLNLRSAASTSASILSSFPVGAQLCITGGPTRANGYEWYQVSGGWIAGDFCTLDRAAGCGTGSTPGQFKVNDRIAVREGPLNIRQTPTTQAAVVGDFAIGTELCALEGPVKADGFEWYRVSSQGKAGWIAGNFCRLVSANGCTVTPDAGRFKADDRVYIAVTELNLRAAPSLTAPVINVLASGTEACVVSGPRYADGLDWYRVRTAAREGWVAGQYAGLAQQGGCRSGVDTSQFRPNDRIRVADGPLHLRQQPAVTGTVVTLLPTWAQLCVRSVAVVYADGYAWYNVAYNGQTGYVAGVFCELVATGGCLYQEGPITPQTAPVQPSGAPVGTVLINGPAFVGKVNVRTTANTTSTSKGVMTKEHYAVVTGAAVLTDNHSWHPVETAFGAGFVAADETVPLSTLTAGRNAAGNPGADGNTNFIFANVPSTTLTRQVVNGNTTARAQNAGTQAYEGLRYESALNLNVSGSGRHYVGVADVLGAGTLDLIVIRVRYTDGTFVDTASAPTINLVANKWQRVVTPRIATSAAKTISKLELHLVRTTAAGAAWSFNADNVKIILLAPPTQWTHQVTNGPLNLRTAGNTSATVIGAMPNGTKLRVISGPVSNQGYSWYNVEAEGFGTGWCVNGFSPI